jgi:hypothetical protein
VVDFQESMFDFVVSGEQALVAGPKGLVLVSLSGTPSVSALAPIADAAKFGFIGANATAFFYTEDGTSVERRDAVTGAVTTIASGVSVSAADSLWADDDWVYVRVDQGGTSSPAALGRVPAAGGPVETIYEDTARDGIQAVTSDACNVYFVAGPNQDAADPPGLFVLGR